MKITKQQLAQAIQEELKALLETPITPMSKIASSFEPGHPEAQDNYDYENPPPAEIIADVFQDALQKILPGYDKNQSLEEEVHNRVMHFSRELHDLLGYPEVKVDPERYRDDPAARGETEELEQKASEHEQGHWMQENKFSASDLINLIKEEMQPNKKKNKES